MVYKPPLKRNTAYAIMITLMAKDEGWAVEILRNHLLSEKDVDDALFLTFFDTYHSSLLTM